MDQCLLLSLRQGLFGLVGLWNRLPRHRARLFQALWIINPHSVFRRVKSLLPLSLRLVHFRIIRSGLSLGLICVGSIEHGISSLFSHRHEKLLVDNRPNVHHSDLSNHTPSFILLPLTRSWGSLWQRWWTLWAVSVVNYACLCDPLSLELHWNHSLLHQPALILLRFLLSSQKDCWFVLRRLQAWFAWTFSNFWSLCSPGAARSKALRWNTPMHACATAGLNPWNNPHSLSIGSNLSYFTFGQAQFAESLL